MDRTLLKILLLTLFLGTLAHAQVSGTRARIDTIRSQTASRYVLIDDSLRVKREVYLDSIGIPNIPPYAGVHFFSRGMLGLFVQYPDGNVRNVDSVGAGGSGESNLGANYGGELANYAGKNGDTLKFNSFAARSSVNYLIDGFVLMSDGSKSIIVPHIPPLTDSRTLTGVNIEISETGTLYAWIVPY